MTREEAIKLIDDRMCFGRGKWSKHHMPERDAYWEAGEMAIKALEQPEIIRCNDCMHNGSFDTDCPIDWAGKDYCNFAERRTDD